MSTEKDRQVLRYIEALFTGDFETQAEILALAQGDEALIQELWETNIRVGEDMAFATQATEVRTLAEGTLNSNILTNPDEAALFNEDSVLESPPILVADVAALLRTEIVSGVARVPDRVAALQATERLSQQNEPLSEDALSERGARTYLHKLGIQVGRWFEGLFHGTAFDLEMGRRENFRMAVARRTRIQKTKHKEAGDDQ